MTTASAKVIIDAEDLASKKMAEAARNVERSIKSIKDTGQRAKASTEFVGALSRSLGGSEIGGYASQLAGLTEKVSQFSEVSKAGGAGALAFKAGLVGLVGTLSFQFGKAMGDAIFQTKHWREEIAKATEESRRLDRELAKSMQSAFSHDREEISLIADPDKQRAANAQLLRDIERQIADTQQQIERKKNRKESNYEAWMLAPKDREALKDVTAENERLNVLREQRDELQEQLSVRRQMIEQAKADNEAAKQAEAEAIRAKEQAAADQQKLLEKAEQARQQAEQKKVDEAKRIADIRQNEIDRLQEEKILLTEGAEAAKRFALERQGVDKDSAARIAAAQEKLKELGKDDSSGGSFTAGTQAVQSRLLTRGPAEKDITSIAKNTEATVKAVEQLTQELKTYKPLDIVVVGS